MRELVKNISDIRENIGYMRAKIENKDTYVMSLLKNGRCFIYDGEGFYPSRFIGYKRNTLEDHKIEHGDGRDTNKEIEKILNKKFVANHYLEHTYKEWIKSLGLIESNHSRRYIAMEVK